MVLSPSAAGPQQAPIAPFLGRILRALQLIGEGGILVLVDEALPGALPLLLRHLMGPYPSVEVLDGVTGIDRVADGGVIVLLPRVAEAEWLNLHRPLFARRALKVVLWSDAATTATLRLQAPDFFDWISHRVECPAMAPPHAVHGLRALGRARVAGGVYRDDSFREALAEAFPGRGLREVSAALPYERILQEVRAGGRDLLAFADVRREFLVRRVRWALAEGQWRRPSLLIGAGPCPGWWRLHGECLHMGEALARLHRTPRAGLLAALCGMEPETIDLCAALVKQGRGEDDFAHALLGADDRGAVMAQTAAAAGLVDLDEVEAGTASPPLLRGLWNHPQVRILRRDRRMRFLAAPTAEDAAVLTARLGSPPRVGTDRHFGRRLFWYLAEAALRSRPRDRATWRWLAQGALAAGDRQAAERWLGLAGGSLGILEEGQDRSPTEIVSVLGNLALLYREQGRYHEAEPLLLRALAIEEEVLGPDHPYTASVVQNLAGLYLSQGRHVEAEPLLQRALQAQERALGPEHLDVARSLQLLAVLHDHMGRYVEAEPLLRRALGIQEKILGPDHPDLATSLHNLAALYQRQGRYVEAEPLLQRALAISEKALGPNHPDLAATLDNLAVLYRQMGHPDKAVPLLQRARAFRDKASEAGE